ncbi:MAG: phage major capsid protein [Phycisphaeraceae bacterium]|nr:phage major capsid protein [Phycisphaeraceae bacterium]
MPAGMSLSEFGDFVQSTGEKLVSNPRKIVNDATKNTYLIGLMLKGRNLATTVRSGSKITDRIMLSDSGTATFYKPGQDIDIQHVDTLRKVQIDWRFMITHFVYEEAELDLNSGDPQTYYKDLLMGKRQASDTAMFNLMEQRLFSPASNADMENEAGSFPYSLPALITPDGLAPSGFTTVCTINPTTEPKWRNQVSQYDPNDVTNFETGLLPAMDEMFLKARFESPEGGSTQYFESDKLQKMKIITNMDGMKLLIALTRDSNDRLVPSGNLGWSAGAGSVTYAGIPPYYASELDTALINSGAVITAGEPWFYYVNFEYLFPVFHALRYMSEKAPITPTRQPTTRVVFKNTYYNLFCQSRRRQGIIVPNTL